MVATRRDPTEREPILTLGRYALHGEIASGGMATVHFGRMSSLGGFSRTVAIKRMRHDIATDPEFVAMFLDEARLTSRVEHPNVVATLDVVAEGGEVFLVMEYVRGESLSRLIRACRHAKERVPMPVAVSIICGGLTGLHAAHDALGEGGAPLGIIHRDVSPQNILVGEDGVTRITDFGIAKAESRAQVTRDGMMKGKLCYMAPEQLSRAGRLLDRRVDIFACAVVAWELISGKKLFQADHPGETMANVLNAPVPPLTGIRDDVTVAVDRAIRKALARNPDQRWKTAEEFALALEDAMPNLGSNRTVGAWVAKIAGDVLAGRTKYVREIESMGGGTGTPISQIKLAPPEDAPALREQPSSPISDQPSGPPPASFERASLSATVQEPAHQQHAPRGPGGIAPPRVPRATSKHGSSSQASAVSSAASQQEQPSVPSIGSAPIPGPAPAPLRSPVVSTPLSASASRPTLPEVRRGVSSPGADASSGLGESGAVRPVRAEPETTLDQPIAAEALNPYFAPAQAQAAAPFLPTTPSPAFPEPSDHPPIPPPPASAAAFNDLPIPPPLGLDSASKERPIPQATDLAFASNDLPIQPSPIPSWQSPDLPIQSQPGLDAPMQFASGMQEPELDYEPPAKLSAKLFATPGRTAAVYLGALGLLGLSITLLIYASRSDTSADTNKEHPSVSQTAVVAPPPSGTTEPGGTATATSPIPGGDRTAESAAPTASTSPSSKGADKSKQPLVPLPPTNRPPGKGVQTYIPDRP